MAIAERSTDTHERQMHDVFNPISGALVGSVKISTAEEVFSAVERARHAQPAWEAMGIKNRLRVIRRWLDLIWDKQTALIDTIREETGKNAGDAYLEILVIDGQMQYYLHHAARILKAQKRAAAFPLIHRVKVMHKPYGVVGVISPWNFPYHLPFSDAIPAIIAGNAVVLKPSEAAPFSAEFAHRLLLEAGIPGDVFQIVHGLAETGSALVDAADYIAFTGSSGVGKKIAAHAGGRLTPYCLELGGKNPAIVLDDANLDMTATGLIRGAFENAGQFCMGISRVYVQAGIYDRLMDRMLHYMNQFALSGAGGMDVHMGSLSHQRELDRTEAHIQEAVSKGARVMYGGKRRPDLGPLFIEPTILADVDHSMTGMQEETFGPIMNVMKINSIDEAVRLCNDTPYGLSACVFGGNLKRAEEVVSQIRVGDATVNRPQIVVGTPSLPSGGYGESGIGRRNGPEGLLRFTWAQSLVVDTLIGQNPTLTQADPFTLKILLLLRKIRRYVSFM